MSRFVSLLLALLVMLAAAPLRAQVPGCAPELAGIVSCVADRLCRCSFERGGSMSAVPTGWRWDCGTLRPYCHRPPALAPAGQVPSGAVIEAPWRPWRFPPTPFPNGKPRRNPPPSERP